MTLTARRCPECGGQVADGESWHRSDCPHVDNLWPPVEEVEVVPVERCVTADCGRAAARLIFIEEAEPPGWFSYCEQCAAELNGEATREGAVDGWERVAKLAAWIERDRREFDKVTAYAGELAGLARRHGGR